MEYGKQDYLSKWVEINETVKSLHHVCSSGTDDKILVGIAAVFWFRLFHHMPLKYIWKGKKTNEWCVFQTQSLVECTYQSVV